MRQPRLGDRVYLKVDVASCFPTKGKTGTIVVHNPHNTGVKFDEFVEGHDCGLKGVEYGHYLYVTPFDYELLEPEVDTEYESMLI